MVTANVLHICLALAVLLTDTTYWSVTAQIEPVRAKSSSSAARSYHGSKLPLFTFHGPVTSGSEAQQDAIILHVLLKTKRRRDGAFVVRTVSYAEKFELQGKVSPDVQIKHGFVCPQCYSYCCFWRLSVPNHLVVLGISSRAFCSPLLCIFLFLSVTMLSEIANVEVAHNFMCSLGTVFLQRMIPESSKVCNPLQTFWLSVQRADALHQSQVK